MYGLPYHKETDFEVVQEFIQRFPLAFLNGVSSNNIPVATQVPLFLEERNDKLILLGHLMKNTDHHKAFVSNSHVLAVFTGPNSYVSGSWYENPHTPSTWNYISVHLQGEIRFLEGDDLIEVLRMTSLHFENNDASSPTAYDNIPKDLTDRLKNAIVAFEIEVRDIDTVFKLSQDRDQESYRNIIRELKKGDSSAQFIAREMEKRIDEMKPRWE